MDFLEVKWFDFDVDVGFVAHYYFVFLDFDLHNGFDAPKSEIVGKYAYIFNTKLDDAHN